MVDHSFILGIDPGRSGGFAVLRSMAGGPKVVAGIATPVIAVRHKFALDQDTVHYHLSRFSPSIYAGIIEYVSAMPRQGVTSSFQFGRMFGSMEYVLYQFCQTQHYVSSPVWKRKLGLGKHKEASRDLATRLFGQTAREKFWPRKKDEGVAEAALIAWYYIKYGGS